LQQNDKSRRKSRNQPESIGIDSNRLTAADVERQRLETGNRSLHRFLIVAAAFGRRKCADCRQAQFLFIAA